MKLYDQIFNVVKDFRKFFSPGPVTNADVSGSITSEILLIVSLVLTCLLLRHVHILLSGLVTLIVLVVLIKNMPLIPKFKIEQDDSLDKMIFYAVMVLGIVVVFVYWVVTLSNSIRTLVASVVTVLFSISLFDALFNLNKVIVPGVSNIYNALGTSISPNLITVVIFDFRGYDTLGESIILLTAGLVVLLVFGRGRLGGKEE